jgi:hypothetical protein
MNQSFSRLQEVESSSGLRPVSYLIDLSTIHFFAGDPCIVPCLTTSTVPLSSSQKTLVTNGTTLRIKSDRSNTAIGTTFRVGNVDPAAGILVCKDSSAYSW